MKYITCAILGAAYSSLWWAYALFKNPDYMVGGVVLGIFAVVGFMLLSIILD